MESIGKEVTIRLHGYPESKRRIIRNALESIGVPCEMLEDIVVFCGEVGVGTVVGALEDAGISIPGFSQGPAGPDPNLAIG